MWTRVRAWVARMRALWKASAADRLDDGFGAEAELRHYADPAPPRPPDDDGDEAPSR